MGDKPLMRCERCFWAYKDNHNSAAECRFDPPSVFPVQQKNQISGQVMASAISMYPPVKGDHFCSHFKWNNQK